MERRYIETNRETEKYFMSLKHATLNDIRNVQGLAHDDSWWRNYHKADNVEKLRLIDAQHIFRNLNPKSPLNSQGGNK